MLSVEVLVPNASDTIESKLRRICQRRRILGSLIPRGPIIDALRLNCVHCALGDVMATYLALRRRGGRQLPDRQSARQSAVSTVASGAKRWGLSGGFGG